MMIPSRCLPELQWHQNAVSCRKTYQRWINSHRFRSQRYRSIPSPSWKNVLGRTIAVIVLLPVILETEIQIRPRHWRPKRYRPIPAPALCQHPQVEKQLRFKLVGEVDWICDEILETWFKLERCLVLQTRTKPAFNDFDGFDQENIQISLITIFRSSS